ncbi:MAG: DUF4433 domain-containing protein [Candidatus Cloacimonetes bacterium]|nr:DUF4433 domain-containing protein [Candidatus Cloacimonadota bacterium]MCB5287716.1 DUF4433 domain-containing protein [Candidatus Cloacimonadota bacterium]MCK9183983.1 DUF4433 domain-containing protein [Candidatus Cloacimonadota bacterium]MCK9583859.1 DUF4433 domain-containing protein [Candidatus Cloacimonadota bacterium]MDY0230037.1 DUF4433 domain-containing protein [Candidatus Cloacimonadaceae bacterium]
MSFKGELFYITHLDNIPSIMRSGILSHNEAERVNHHSVALQDVQDKRAIKKIPKGRVLHDYVNLYFNPRNPMMYKLFKLHMISNLCVLSVHPNILKVQDAVVSDQNAARNLVRFYDPKVDFDKLDFENIYLRDWNVPDRHEYDRLKGIVCAETLIPDKMSFDHINSAYVVDDSVSCKLSNMGFNRPIIIEPDMFFRG